MPIINGIKMACEPCIRGHRSTKCNHANDRVMLPVRKPGRPLSICPHPPSNPCACGSVTAAIPRTRKCGCGSKNASNSSSSKAARSPAKRTFFRPPPSPKTAAHGPIDPNAHGRTGISQMNIQAAPSNWPAASASASTPTIMPSPGSQNGTAFILTPDALTYNCPVMFTPGNAPFQNGYHVQSPAGPQMYTDGGESEFNSFLGNAGLSLPLGQLPLPPGSELENLSLNMGQPMSMPPQNTNMSGPNGANGVNSVNGMNGMDGYRNVYQQLQTATPSQAMPPPPTAAAPVKRSCCGGGEPAQLSSTESPKHTPTSSTTSLNSNAGTAKSSCCSTPPLSSYTISAQAKERKGSDGASGESVLDSPRTSSDPDVKPSDLTSLDNPFSSHQTDTMQPVPLDPHVFGDFSQSQSGPTWYRYPPGYGTVTAPLQHAQWRAGLVAGDPNLFSKNMQFQDPSLSVHYATDAEELDDAHMCSCGDDCDCIGCAVHPYNIATRNTIQSAWTSLLDEASNVSTSSTIKAAPSATTPSETRSTTPSQVSATMSTKPSATLVQTSNGTEASSSPQTHTPSDTSGGGDDQVSLPAGDFLFVSYSVMGCSGEGLTCPCGDDCQCIGCTIHNNVPA